MGTSDQSGEVKECGLKECGTHRAHGLRAGHWYNLAQTGMVLKVLGARKIWTTTSVLTVPE